MGRRENEVFVGPGHIQKLRVFRPTGVSFLIFVSVKNVGVRGGLGVDKTIGWSWHQYNNDNGVNQSILYLNTVMVSINC